MKITIEYIEKTEEGLVGGGFTVTKDDKYADRLGYDEMLGLVAALTMPESRPTLQWMKTEEQHKAWIDRLNKPKEKE